jgi:hypothetical protein
MNAISQSTKDALGTAASNVQGTIETFGTAYKQLVSEYETAAREAHASGQSGNVASAIGPDRTNEAIRSVMVANGLLPLLERKSMRGADHHNIVESFPDAFAVMLRGV